MEHSQPARQDTPPNDRDTSLSENPYGTWFAETIRASGRVRRANRPDTRLLLTSAKTISEKSCYAGAIHTGHSSVPQREALSSPEPSVARGAAWSRPVPLMAECGSMDVLQRDDGIRSTLPVSSCAAFLASGRCGGRKHGHQRDLTGASVPPRACHRTARSFPRHEDRVPASVNTAICSARSTARMCAPAIPARLVLVDCQDHAWPIIRSAMVRSAGPDRQAAHFSLMAKCLRTGSSMVQVPLKLGSTVKASPGNSVIGVPPSGVMVMRPSIKWTNS